MLKKIIVIGAGPAGLAAAYELSKNKAAEVVIVEASNYIGGMARSFELFGQVVDCGPHRFFSKQKLINNFFTELIKDDHTLVKRQTRIYYNNQYFDYPLKGMDVMKKFNVSEIISILTSYLSQKILNPIKVATTFEEWVTKKFGKKLYEIFFKNYSEKLWGIPCSKIDSDWAAQRIKSLSLFEAIKNAFIGDKHQKHKTLVDQFSYPKGGTGVLYQRAAEEIVKNGGQILMNCFVKNLIFKNEKAVGCELANGEIINADFIVSTMPLTQLVKNINFCPKEVKSAADKLYFRNTILLYLEIDGIDHFPDNWIYIHSQDVKHGRITNFRNWCPSLYRGKKSSILCMEFWAFEDDHLWNSKDLEIELLGITELKKIKLLKPDFKVLNTHVLKIPKCYPVYETGYQQHLKTISSYLNTISNLIPIGRYGAYKYNNQDHSILMGILAAKKILNDENINLWSINTDTEYQEEGRIKDVLI